MANFKGVLKCTQEQYNKLLAGEIITIGDKNYIYDENVLYTTEDDGVDLNEVKGQIKTITYDNTTLKDHLDEIMSYTNIENEGTLLSIGFKTKALSVLANVTKATIANAANPVVATTSQVVLKPATFYSFRSANIETDKLTLNGPNGIEGCSSTNVEITSSSCQMDGWGSTVNADGAIEMICFKKDLLSIPLEYLVIDYFTVQGDK